MKTLAALLITLMVSQAEAGTWIATKCSNSDGTVKWESGYQEDLIDLKYANFVEGILTLPMDQVVIQFSKGVVLKEKSFRSCQYSGSSKVHAGKVKITAADKNPDVLRSLFPENKVETEVICTTVVTEDAACAKGEK